MKRNRYILIFLCLAVAVVILLMANVCIGSVSIPLNEVLSILREGCGSSVASGIVLEIRLPRALAAAILGGGLALSGYLLQTFFHNPIAGPFILGISSGAKLVVALVMVYLLERAMQASSLLLIVAAFAGAMLSMGFVLLMSKVLSHMATLIVSGVMIGYICTAITDFVVTFADDSDIVNLHNWSQGSFSGISWDNVMVMAVVIFLTSACVFLMSKPISAYQMGEAYAQSMGLNIKLFRALLVLLSSLLSACVTAFAGPVSFVGIAVPQIVKNLFRTSRPLLMIPASFLGGAAFCMFCDLLARTLFSPTELSISTVTAVFGAPVVIVILLRTRKEGM
ncbi:iron ABC transporter permease [Mediterraneibacter glycyrrhizinilyticus]|uniref:FecCD family ABC transporter permease n=1 Tax=Mediterraneibacter glycyrrhizinilyticus TaxID=342942 RepID=UPI0019610B3A|nr:iron ABC transporter permease [Mediterraneibacter glycyrrhizinilyticus]MBM6752819.1 iron ABC transporter permease [Mediterraneibacter glycyrrhizinilyticus]